MAERQALRNAILVGGIDFDTLAEIATALGTLGLQQVPATRSRPDHFAAGRDLEALGDRFLCSNSLRTTHSSVLSVEKSAQYRNRRRATQGVFPAYFGAVQTGSEPGRARPVESRTANSRESTRIITHRLTGKSLGEAALFGTVTRIDRFGRLIGIRSRSFAVAAGRAFPRRSRR